MRLLALLIALCAAPLAAQERLVLGATTTTENSGLLGFILPQFSAETGIRVDVVALGTRQVLAMAANGDLDVVIVHHRPSEDTFMAAGDGDARFDLMFNDFVIIGPSDDPAQVATANTPAQAFARIGAVGAKFVSRGDESGTHLRELSLWQAAGLTPDGRWYSEVGSGMGASLNIAAALSTYILSDRSTWLSFSNRADLTLLYEGGPELRNTYALITVSAARHPHINARAAHLFAQWMTGPAGQAAIANYRLNDETLFCPITPQAGQQQGKTCAAGQN